MRLIKQLRYNKNGVSKINSYAVNISKKILTQTDIKDSDEVIVYAKDNKIIIEKK